MISLSSTKYYFRVLYLVRIHRGMEYMEYMYKVLFLGEFWFGGVLVYMRMCVCACT